MATTGGEGRSRGTSPTTTITAEDMNPLHPHIISDVDATGIVRPPELGVGGSPSEAMSYIQPWPSWNYTKMTEPKFDGVTQYLGQMSNRPDFISDYHFIGLMRNAELILGPKFDAYIDSYSNMPRPTRAPVPRTDGE